MNNEKRIKEIIKNLGYSYVKKISDHIFSLISDDKITLILKRFRDYNSYQNEKKYSIITSKMGISPKVYNYDDNESFIITEEITMIASLNDTELLNNIDDPVDFLVKFYNKVESFQSEGFGHGDLHIGNVGYIVNELGEQEPYIIDWEKAYKILNHDWTTELWTRNFDVDSYSEFVNYDYKGVTLEFGWYYKNITLPEIPITIVPSNEEYYKIRFVDMMHNYYICGECGIFAQKLQKKIGGDIVGLTLFDSKLNNIPSHYLVLTEEGDYIDGTGVYTNKNSLLKLSNSMLQLEGKFYIEIVDPINLNNIELTPKETKEMDSYIKEIVDNIISSNN